MRKIFSNFVCFSESPNFNKLEQLEFKLEKIIGIQKHAGNVRKKIILWKSVYVN